MEWCLLLMAVDVGGDAGGVIIGSGNVGRKCFLCFFVGSEADWPVTTFVGGLALPRDGREHSRRHRY